jgi:hypothetical protein
MHHGLGIEFLLSELMILSTVRQKQRQRGSSWMKYSDGTMKPLLVFEQSTVVGPSFHLSGRAAADGPT